MKALGFAAILISVGMMAACTVTSGNGDTSGDGGAGGDGSTTTTSSATTGEGGSGGTGGGEGGGGTGGANVCAEETGDECMDCCVAEHPAEAEALGKLQYWFCGCAAEAPCAADCDTTDATSDVCGDEAINPDVDNSACDICIIQAAEECYIAAEAACADADDCKALMTCGDACQ
ncbi:hypothetical protein [Sorangium sp. So ce426]|uniref:hypothetical protein n=1 Tax=Sorangium sp. So ce426 TaxID=3133312 RepID=UPI003F5B4CF8